MTIDDAGLSVTHNLKAHNADALGVLVGDCWLTESTKPDCYGVEVRATVSLQLLIDRFAKPDH